jgi:hypothetical protein
MIIKTIHVKSFPVYVSKDGEGYLSLSTDGWDTGMLAPLIKALHTLQTDEDREADAMRAQHEAWVKDRERGWR